jgi:hypothetical protein
VSQRFDGLLSSIKLTDTQKENGKSARESVCTKLNLNYYGSSSSTANSRFVGSWDKLTRIRPPRDVDVLFTLPEAVYQRFQGRSGNRQSQLLQEIKGILALYYPNTDIRGDGPVVVVNLSTYTVELIPAFELTNGHYWIPVTRDGGKYETSDYTGEATAIRDSNTTTNGNTRDLVRMAKCWQGVCNVPIKSFWLEILAKNFLQQWEHAGKSKTYYDWMTRDFFIYLVNQFSSYIYAPGTYESIYLGSTWKSKAETARDNAKSAVDNESGNYPSLALLDWQKIYGSYIS